MFCLLTEIVIIMPRLHKTCKHAGNGMEMTQMKIFDQHQAYVHC